MNERESCGEEIKKKKYYVNKKTYRKCYHEMLSMIKDERLYYDV